MLVKDITFNSACEHHMMPFTGKAHVAYMPVDKVVGLSKLARLVDVYARRLQTQEHMNAQIATAIEEILKPRGVAVMIEAEHTCMSLRGVEKPGSLTVTTQFRGAFRDDPNEQLRFISHGARHPALMSLTRSAPPAGRGQSRGWPCRTQLTDPRSRKASCWRRSSTPTASSPALPPTPRAASF